MNLSTQWKIEVTGQVAPHRMDMVRCGSFGVGLVVAQFRDEAGALDAEKVLFGRLHPTRPTEMDLIHPVLLDQIPSVFGNRFRKRC